MRAPFNTKLLQYIAGQLQNLYIEQYHLIPADLTGHIHNLWEMPYKHQQALTICIAQIVSFDNDFVADLRGFNPPDRTEHTLYFVLQFLFSGSANEYVKLLTSMCFVPDVQHGLPRLPGKQHQFIFTVGDRVDNFSVAHGHTGQVDKRQHLDVTNLQCDLRDGLLICARRHHTADFQGNKK